MSYPKKSTSTKNPTGSAAKGTNSRLTEEKRERLVAIQQREQLKGMLVNKFVEKYEKQLGKSRADQHINKEVAEFLKNEKLTEENLKKLEQRIKDGPQAGLRPKSVNNPEPQTSQPNEQPVQQITSANQHEKAKSHVSFPQDLRNDDELSVTSSTRPKSIYVQEDEDDEWATMLKYDAELYKKEKELARQRDADMKKKIKEELERQILEKKRLELGDKALEDHMRRQ